ncbi:MULTISPECIES: hypothetical protein [unclassified Paracoccus (in: a-proteobacteria)]|uniref:hypothetical protein n=1 Tax=unclassified Paracoccus (in: a-proteobacteria) TaxID=2688777 RepID=UPI0012B27D3D|nr:MULTISPECIES: hypothetical protein [unclassified Paracoccus (in: a-proteobacteria)]UXU75267.1 hypothetical protein GB879_001820 [Paracoccus sp. SMMA_5]UXU81169.1 hypothetical protein GB880_001815 [Paracoccus sp. SMMA_5_TC]
MAKIARLGMLGAGLLCLAACAENTGWNPNYSAMHNGSRYAAYVQQREAALQGRAAVPPVIPLALPVQAPTAADIAGTTARRQVAPGTVRVSQRPAAQPAPATVAAAPANGPTPMLVRYAHQQTHAPGTRVYPRSGGSDAAAMRLCRGFADAAAAQAAFLAAGGPLIDPRGMDPDGDGYVCGWDPAPYRQPRL